MTRKGAVRLTAYERQQLEGVAGYVQEHLAAPLEIEETALVAGISPYKFKAGFLEVYGQHFTDYLKMLRMRKAARLLLETNELVAVVGKACGYRNEASFYRAFKQWSGQTPDAFRKG